jgi:nucleoside 2-deoxyribosyltransferase
MALSYRGAKGNTVQRPDQSKEAVMNQVMVIMPYVEPWSDRVWDALHRIEQQDTTGSIQVSRVDTRNIRADNLADHIQQCIAQADVLIADLTNVNPNVHIEIGFLLALRKPLLFITQDRKWVTTHLQGRVIDEYNAADNDSLSRLTGTMFFRVRDKIEVIRAREESERARISKQEIYQVECYSHRAAVGLEKYFREARNRVDILTTNLSFLFEEYDSSTGRTYFDELKSALNREGSRLKVRVLTLDPESDFAAKRGKQLGFSPAVFRDMLRQALTDTRQIAATYPIGRFEVRTYEDFPNQITFRVDNWIFNCVVAQPTQSRNHLTFKLDRQNQGVDNSFINHFQNVWGK